MMYIQKIVVAYTIYYSFNYSISLLITCTLRRNGLARTGVSIVVMKQILTATEYNVISSIPTENARAVIANPTVPLPFSSDARARLSMLLNLKILAPRYPPTVLVAIAAPISMIRYGIDSATD